MARTAIRKPTTPGPKSPLSTVTSVSASSIPEPFKRVPAALQPFTSTLPTNHIYIVHIDRTSTELKQRVFAVPFLLNVVLILLLCVRLYFAAPVYLQQIITIFGYDTAYSVDTEHADTSTIFGTIGERTLLLMADYVIFAILGSWPREFVFGSKNSRYTGPWEWRKTNGFGADEVIVRKGRKWDAPLLQSSDTGTKIWGKDEELSIKLYVGAAMRKSYISKTGYLLLDKDWDFDFKAMIDAQKMIKTGDLKMSDLEEITLVYYQNQWLVWNVHENEAVFDASPEQERQLRTFKDKLTSLGQEDAFFRWIEIIQFETNQPGGFTQGRQAEALRELKRLLTTRGVDYAKFWEEIGGRSGVPGLPSSKI